MSFSVGETWKGFAPPKDLSGTTSGALLQNKRSRDLRELVKRMPHHTSEGPQVEDAARRVSKALAQLRELRR